MRFPVLATVVCAGLIAVWSVLAAGGMILTTPEGRKIMLNDDATWAPADKKEMIVEKDFTVEIGDGRIVLVGADRSWGFVDKAVKYAEDELLATRIVGKGSGSSVNVDAARNTALKQAIDNASRKVPGSITSVKLTVKKVSECVQMVEKDVSHDEQFVKGKGWTVNTTVTLDKGSILAVIGCASDTAKSTVK